MPMRRALYPPDWDELAVAVKDAAGWRCEGCGAEHGSWRRNRHGKLARVILAACHLLDPNPASRDGLGALCQWDHLEHDRDQHRQSRRATLRARKAICDLWDWAATSRAA